MTTLERTVERRQVTEAPLKRTSWGAIFGGSFIAIGIMIVLSALGVAIGAATIDPATGDSPSPGTFGIWAGVWWIASGAIALFGGGWAAGRLAGLSRRYEGPLHGAVMWALTTVAMVLMTTTVLGALVGGAFRVVGATAQGATAVRGQIDDASERIEQTASSAVQAMEENAAQAAETAVSALGGAAWWTFFYLLLTIAAAMIGGQLGSPRSGRRYRREPAPPEA